MEFSGIEFPNQLIKSLQNGTCIIFAGAGVSMYQPANLPNFKDLARRLTGQEPVEPFDSFLGRHPESSGFKRRTLDLVSAAIQHNPIHEQVVRLFPDLDRLRIVTTNYDRLFQSACQHVFGSQPTVYQAPALPLGRQFTGLVHIHGGLSDEHGIVLTDVDFGGAYLVDGWARQFLVGLFQSWDILFVGYSHDDVVMTYLARALPPSRDRVRFALVDVPSEKWLHLGITPIGYGNPARPTDHEPQVTLLAEVAAYLRKSVLDWAEILSVEARRDPPNDKAFTTQLRYALQSELYCRCFLDHNPCVSWVDWLANEGFLIPLFVVSQPFDAVADHLSFWLCHQVIREHPGVIFRLFAQQKNLNPIAWHHLTHGLLSIPTTTEPSEVAGILGIALHRMPTKPDPQNVQWLAEVAGRHACVEVLVSLLSIVLSNESVFEVNGSQPDEIHCKSRFRYSQHNQQKVIEALIPHVKLCVHRVFHIVCGCLQERRAIDSGWRDVHQLRDFDSFGRSAIEPHDQDRHLDAIDPSVNFARELLSLLSASDPNFVRGWIPLGLASSSSLLQRLALHASAFDQLLDVDLAIDYLASGPIANVNCHHEVFLLARKLYSIGNVIQRERLLEIFVLGYEYDITNEEDGPAHRFFTLISYLALEFKEDPILTHRLALLIERHPDFQVSDHPDFTHYFTTRWGGDPCPYTDEQFLRLSPQELLADAQARQANPRHEFDSSDYYNGITRVASANPLWRQALFSQALSQAPSLRLVTSALVQSFCASLRLADEINDSLRILAQDEVLYAHLGLIASSIVDFVDKNPPDHAAEWLSALDEIAVRVWHRARQEMLDDPSDWLQGALNSSSGKISFYVVSVLSLRCRLAGKGSRPPIPPMLKEIIAEMLSDRTGHGRRCQAVLVSQIQLFVWLDDATTQQLAGMLASADTEISVAAWQGFLSWGQLTPALAHLLAPAFQSVVDNQLVESFGKKRRFIQYLLIAGAMISPAQANKWATERRLHADVDLSEAISSQSIAIMREADAVTLREHWQGWIGPYWRQRANGQPLALRESEIALYLDSLDNLEPVMGDAASIIGDFPSIEISTHCMVFYSLHEKKFDEKYPHEVASVCRFALTGIVNPSSFYDADKVLHVVVPHLLDHELRKSLVELAIQRRAITSNEGLAILKKSEV